MSTSNRSWRRCATPSSPNCTRVPVVCLVECLEASQALAVLLLEVVDPQAPPSRKSIKPNVPSHHSVNTKHVTPESQSVNVVIG